MPVVVLGGAAMQAARGLTKALLCSRQRCLPVRLSFCSPPRLLLEKNPAPPKWKIRNLANITVPEREDAIAFLIALVLLNCKWQRAERGMSGVSGSRVIYHHLLRGKRVCRRSAWRPCWQAALVLRYSLLHTCGRTRWLHGDPPFRTGS